MNPRVCPLILPLETGDFYLFLPVLMVLSRLRTIKKISGLEHSYSWPLILPMTRAGDRIRTGECQLGRLMPYHLATPAYLFDYLMPLVYPTNL
jgi:hypothetical protein